MMIDHRDVVGATEFANSSAKWVKAAEEGRDVIIAKNNHPTAALVGIGRLQDISSSHVACQVAGRYERRPVPPKLD